MAHKGFIRVQDDELPDRELMKRFQQKGIPMKNIFTDSCFSLDAEWLRNGDYLTVRSLSELLDKPELVLCVLATMVSRNIHLYSLDEPWYDTNTEGVRQYICGLADISSTMLCRRKSQQSKQKRYRGRPRGLTPESLAKCRICENMLFTTKQPLLSILKSQELCYATWRRYAQECELHHKQKQTKQCKNKTTIINN